MIKYWWTSFLSWQCLSFSPPSSPEYVCSAPPHPCYKPLSCLMAKMSLASSPSLRFPVWTLQTRKKMQKLKRWLLETEKTSKFVSFLRSTYFLLNRSLTKMHLLPCALFWLIPTSHGVIIWWICVHAACHMRPGQPSKPCSTADPIYNLHRVRGHGHKISCWYLLWCLQIKVLVHCSAVTRCLLKPLDGAVVHCSTPRIWSVLDQLQYIICSSTHMGFLKFYFLFQ